MIAPVLRSEIGGVLASEGGSILLVFVVGLTASLVIVGLYALRIRLFAVGAPDDDVVDGEDPEGPTATVAAREHARPVAATAAGIACFVAFAAAVLYGIYLVIPLFH